MIVQDDSPKKLGRRIGKKNEEGRSRKLPGRMIDQDPHAAVVANLQDGFPTSS